MWLDTHFEYFEISIKVCQVSPYFSKINVVAHWLILFNMCNKCKIWFSWNPTQWDFDFDFDYFFGLWFWHLIIVELVASMAIKSIHVHLNILIYPSVMLIWVMSWMPWLNLLIGRVGSQLWKEKIHQLFLFKCSLPPPTPPIFITFVKVVINISHFEIEWWKSHSR